MKKISALLIAVSSFMMVKAQDSTIGAGAKDTIHNSVDTSAPKTLQIITPDQSLENSAPASTLSKKILPSLNIGNRASDHLLIQIGYENWANKTDSVRMKGISRSFSMYFMYNFPLKTNPHLSVGLGVGISSSNIYFSNTNLDVAGKSGTTLNFTDLKDTTHFKKYKLLTTYLEAPVEIRYVKDPLHPKKSFKAAAGVKVGTMLSAGTKGKNLQSSTGQLVSNFIEKEKSKRYFNTTRISATGRVGIGAISLFANYQLNAFIKSGFGPDVRPYTIGITISGL
jgi:hypothetical protein